MKSLEKKSMPMLDCPMSSDFPSFYVDGEQMPEIKEWKTDKEYTMTFKIKMTRQEKITDLDKERFNATIELLSYEK